MFFNIFLFFIHLFCFSKIKALDNWYINKIADFIVLHENVQTEHFVDYDGDIKRGILKEDAENIKIDWNKIKFNLDKYESIRFFKQFEDLFDCEDIENYKNCFLEVKNIFCHIETNYLTFSDNYFVRLGTF